MKHICSYLLAIVFLTLASVANSFDDDGVLIVDG